MASGAYDLVDAGTQTIRCAFSRQESEKNIRDQDHVRRNEGAYVCSPLVAYSGNERSVSIVVIGE